VPLQLAHYLGHRVGVALAIVAEGVGEFAPHDKSYCLLDVDFTTSIAQRRTPDLAHG
jgi:hypothetical protein